MFTLKVITAPRLRELFKKGKLALHEEGLLSLLKASFFGHEVYLLFENSLDGHRFPCLVDNLTLRVVTCPEELDQLSAEGFNFSEYTETILGRQTLFLAFVGKELAHGTQVFHDKSGINAIFCPSSMDDGHTAYMGGIRTARRYRRKGINAFISSEIFQYLRDKGMSRAITIVSKGNIAEENSLVKLGSYLWGEGHHLRVLFLFDFWWVKPKARATFGRAL